MFDGKKLLLSKNMIEHEKIKSGSCEDQNVDIFMFNVQENLKKCSSEQISGLEKDEI